MNLYLILDQFTDNDTRITYVGRVERIPNHQRQHARGTTKRTIHTTILQHLVGMLECVLQAVLVLLLRGTRIEGLQDQPYIFKLSSYVAEHPWSRHWLCAPPFHDHHKPRTSWSPSFDRNSSKKYKYPGWSWTTYPDSFPAESCIPQHLSHPIFTTM